jgi:hypothetical protein
MKERLTHMPTTVAAWGMVVALGAVIWAVVQFAGPGVIKTAIQAQQADQPAGSSAKK